MPQHQRPKCQRAAHLRRRNKLTGREALRITQVEAVSRKSDGREKPGAQFAHYNRPISFSGKKRHNVGAVAIDIQEIRRGESRQEKDSRDAREDPQ